MAASTPNDNGDGTTWATRSGASCEALSMRWASTRFDAIRASQRTCLPAWSAATETGACMLGHVPTTTASMPGSDTNSGQSSKIPGIPWASATRADESRERFATPTISTPSTARNPGMWRSMVFRPAPTIPTRSGGFTSSSLVVLSHQVSSWSPCGWRGVARSYI